MNWELTFLGIMAVALVGMAVAQVMLAREAARLARQATDALLDFRRELLPIVVKLQRTTEDVGRAAALARQQVERVDQVLGSTIERIDETVAIVQDAVVRPLRQGTAILAGVRAAMEVFGAAGRPTRRPAREEEEDALFVG